MLDNHIDNELFDLVDKALPDFTRELAEGFAVSQLRHNDQYVHALFEQIARNFPPNLKYLGPKSISPYDEFKIVSNFKRGSKRIYDLSLSNVYMKLYRFSLDGIEIKPVPLHHIFVEDGAMLYIKNAKYAISPVIADVALSVKGDSIFLHLTRARLTFKKFLGYMLVDGEKQSAHIVWSQVYNTKTRTILTTLPHYLFCKFGVHGAFKRQGVDVIIVPKTEYSMERFPEEDWVVCTSAGKRTGNRNKTVITTDIAIIIPRTAWESNSSIRSLVGGFFYIADYYPLRINSGDYDNPKLWRVLLGKAILPPGDSEGKIINQINTHMTSVDGYIDGLVKERLNDVGYRGINDIYDLFELVIAKYQELVAQNTDSVASLYGKRLVVNLYVNKDIINAISNVLFSIQKHINSKGTIKQSELETILNRTLKYNLAMRINRGHSEVKSVSSASDCLIHKITSVTLMQTETTTSATGPTFDESKVAHTSIAEIGGIMNLPSGDPTGRSRLNMCAKVDEKGTLLRNPDLIPILEPAQQKIAR